MSRPSTLARTAEILQELTAQPTGLAFNELRRRCGHPVPSTLSRLLEHLLAIAWVSHRADSYRIGPALQELAGSIAGQHSLAERVAPVLRQLAQDSGCSSAWWEQDGDQVVLQAKYEIAESFHYVSPGFARPVSDSAFGSVILASQSLAECRRVCKPQLPNASHRDQASLHQELQAIRAAGYCLREDTGSVIPITRICSGLGPPGEAARASIGISIPGPQQSIAQLDRLVEAVQLAAVRAAERCGWNP
jgi:DNA-binding IclR family transcriptional regulator